ncbi:MAG: large-conductance mechanosensitive channel protein MscL [Bacillota bacterium]|nr:large-conductance mechanosensitive channel protein MscL [Bacillota bacterium]
MKKKGFIAEFKEFAMKGNVVEIAIGMIIGTAFTAIVSSFVADIITPLLSIVIGHISFADLSWNISATLGLKTETPILLTYGKFIQSVFDFLLIALSIFICIKVANNLRSRLEHKEDEDVEEAPAEPSEEVALLTEIRDLLKEKQ